MLSYALSEGQDKGSGPTPLPILPCGVGLFASLNANKKAEYMKRMIALLLVFAFPVFSVKAEVAPPTLLNAIGIQESGMNPFAVNVAGEGHNPATREEALQIIRQAQSAGKSFDVGVFQINSWWMARYNIPPESLLDPAINRQWGMFVLSQEIARHGLNWKAVGKYHSPDVERGRRYAWDIYRHYTALAGDKEVGNGKAAHGSQKLSVPGGIQRRSGVRPQGRVITFDVQQTSVPGDASSKPGASRGPAGTAKD